MKGFEILSTVFKREALTCRAFVTKQSIADFKRIRVLSYEYQRFLPGALNAEFVDKRGYDSGYKPPESDLISRVDLAKS